MGAIDRGGKLESIEMKINFGIFMRLVGFKDVYSLIEMHFVRT